MAMPTECSSPDELHATCLKQAMAMSPVSSFPNEFRASDFEKGMMWPASAHPDAFRVKDLAQIFSRPQGVAFGAVNFSFYSSLSALVCWLTAFCSCHVPDAVGRH